MLDALAVAGIDEVYVVRGYLAEQFDQLLYKYPDIEFIENPLYNEANNISSIVAAKDVLAMLTSWSPTCFCATLSS